jgi:ubiquinone/menaquinone biosynthesis C-methylase UbiE
MEESEAWSVYWQNNHQESCIAKGNTEDNFILSDIWRCFSLQLSHCSTVLDLATGNGSVARRLIQFNKSLKVTAVDRASIDPKKYTDANVLLSTVHFIPDINIQKLPFDDCVFDAVTSQFGLEYSNLSLSTPELVRVLKHKGQFLFVIHHDNSEVVIPAKVKIKEFNLLLASGLLDNFELFLAGSLSLQQLNAEGEKILNNATWSKSDAITGQVFLAIDKLIQLKNQNQNLVVIMEAFKDMKTRIDAENSRLNQLILASLSKDKVKKLCTSLEKLGTKVSFKLIQLNDNAGVMGWKIRGYKL